MPVGALVASGIAIAVGLVLVAFFRYTMLGRGVRSVIQDEVGARLCGVNPSAVRTFIFGVSGALACLVAVTRSMTGPIGFGNAISFTTLALIVAVVGGLGSVSGAFLAGVLLGHRRPPELDLHRHIRHDDRSLAVRGADDRAPSERTAREAGMTVGVDAADRSSGHRRSCIPRVALLAYIPILVAAALLALLPLRYHDSAPMMRVITEGMLFAAYVGRVQRHLRQHRPTVPVHRRAGRGRRLHVAIFADRVGLPMAAAIVVGVAIAATVGGLLSWISVKRALGTIFVGIVTLAFSLSFDSLILGRSDLFGGDAGLRVEAGTDTFLREKVPPYYMFLALVVVYLVVFRLLQRSRTGWAFRAFRDDMVAAELAGVDVARYRVFAGVLGSAMLGLAGALYAFSERVDRTHHVRIRPRRRPRDRDARVRWDRIVARTGRRCGHVHVARRVPDRLPRDAFDDLRLRDHRPLPRLPPRRRAHRHGLVRHGPTLVAGPGPANTLGIGG